jgi:hypothetical protein
MQRLWLLLPAVLLCACTPLSAAPGVSPEQLKVYSVEYTQSAVDQATRQAGTQLAVDQQATLAAARSTQQVLDLTATAAPVIAQQTQLAQAEAARRATMTAEADFRQATRQAQGEDDQATQAAAVKTQAVADQWRHETQVAEKAAAAAKNNSDIDAMWHRFWWGLASAAIVALVVIVIVFLGTLWNASDIIKDFFRSWTRLRLATEKAKLEKQRLELERLKVMVVGKHLLTHGGTAWRQLNPGAVIEGQLRGDQDIPLADPYFKYRLKVREFLVRCIDYWDQRKDADGEQVLGEGLHIVPSAEALGLHSQERDRMIKLLRRYVVGRRGKGGGTYTVGDLTLYDMLEANRLGQLELDVTEISQS